MSANTEKQDEGGKGPTEEGSSASQFYITVNRRQFEAADGVKEHMTGAEIAALVNVAADNAVVRRDEGHDKGEVISLTHSIKIHLGDKFLVTRKTVEGGHGGRA